MDDKSPAYENFMNKMAAMNSGPKINVSTMKIGGLEKRVGNYEKKITKIKNIFKAQKIDIGDKISPKDSPIKVTLEATNEILRDVSEILTTDYLRRQEEEEKEIKKMRDLLRKKRQKDSEDELEAAKKSNKKVGGFISKTSGNLVKPFTDIFGRIGNFLTLIGIGGLVNTAFSFFADKENRMKFDGAFTWLTENWKLVLGGIAAIAGAGVIVSLIGAFSGIGTLFGILLNPYVLLGLGLTAAFIHGFTGKTGAERVNQVLQEQYGGDRKAMIADLEKIMNMSNKELQGLYGSSVLGLPTAGISGIRKEVAEQIYFLKTGQQIRYGFNLFKTAKDYANEAEYNEDLDFSTFKDSRIGDTPIFNMFDREGSNVKPISNGEDLSLNNNNSFEFVELPPIDMRKVDNSIDKNSSATTVIDGSSTNGFNEYMSDVPIALGFSDI